MKLQAAAIVAHVGLLAVPLPLRAAEEPLDLCGYKLLFNESFDELSIAPRLLDSARWISHTPWNGDFGDARFTDNAPAGPFSVTNGILSITARKDDAGKWRSGLLAASDGTGAGFGIRYGYFEARMRLPPGPGTWPAFWLGTKRPNTDKTPSVEIDVIEYYGHSTAAYSAALHVWYKGENQKRSTHTVQKVAVLDGSLLEAFHTYGVLVTSETITYYLDRKSVWRKPTPPELNKPLFPLVNLALGSGFPIDKTPNPSVLFVDYVHVYAPNPEKSGNGCVMGGPIPGH